MANAPAGWFDDGSGRQRWWDGAAWTDRYLDEYTKAVPTPRTKPTPKTVKPTATQAVPTKVATTTATQAVPTKAATTKATGAGHSRLVRNIVIGIVGLVCISLVASAGWAGLLLLIGIAVLASGIYALVVGSFRAIRVKSRASAALVLIVGLAIVSAGGSAVAATIHSGQNLAASQSESTEAPTVVKKSEAPTPIPTPTPTPVRTTKQVEERTPIPFASSTVDDANLDAGTTAVAVVGVAGEKLTTWSVVYEDGVEISRSVASEATSIAPVNEVIANGTRQPAPAPEPVVAPAPEPVAEAGNGCDTNYADACVPIDSDVDCAGGSGNGPSYVAGPVRIVGSDIYDLDRDGDGIACD